MKQSNLVMLIYQYPPKRVYFVGERKWQLKDSVTLDELFISVSAMVGSQEEKLAKLKVMIYSS